MAMKLLLFVSVTLLLGSLVDSHGMIHEPPGRSTAWRHGFDTPINYEDNELFCGGFDHQWAVNGGKCGICGDPYDGPRGHEAGGKYATGTIVRYYRVGQVMPVLIQLTANHIGWFEFRICPNNNIHKPASQDCLDVYLLPLADGSGTRFHVKKLMTHIELHLQLPPGLTCTQCVLQWRYNTGNRWGVEPSTGRQGMGLGAQEQFYGCSDVAITQSGVPPPTVRPPTTTTTLPTTIRPTTRPTTRSTPRPRTTTTPPVTDRTTRKPRSSTTLRPRSSVRPTPTPLPKSTTTVPKYTSHPNMRCKAIGSWEGSPSQDRWCNNNCQIGNCPPDFCHCDVTMKSTVRPASTVAPGDKTTCRSKGDWPNKDSMDRWCARNCPMNNCPEDVCECV